MAESGTTGEGAELVQRRQKCRVVIVEDNALARETLQELLEYEGYQVAAEKDGARGLALILATRPDFALVDLSLPGLDGCTVAKRLQEAEAPPATRLIAVSGYGDEAARAASLAAGFSAHLTKPLDLDRLTTLLDAG